MSDEQQEALRLLRQIGLIDDLGIWQRLPEPSDVAQIIALARQTQLISMCIKADPPSQPAKQSEGAAKTVADQWRDYLLGGCSDPDNCNLCRTEKWAKAVGMHHAGIPWNKPPSQPAEQSTAPKREQSKSNATPRDQAIYKGIADNYHATVAIEQSTDKDARPVEKIMGIINETGDPKHTFTRAVMMERLRKSQEATNWQYVSFAEFDKIAARFALLERAVERISSYADHYIDADLIAQIREALK